VTEYASADGLPPFGGGDLDDETERRSWQAVDTEPVLDGTWKPADPTVGRRLDGVGLFYPGKCHTIASESEGGKTWFALSACLDEIRIGNHVLYIDFEDDVGGVVNRLIVMGANRNDIRERFTYLRPLDPIGRGINRDDLNRILDHKQPTLSILDGITEALAMHGFDANKNNEVADFGLLLPRYIAKTGTAVASLDHVVKNGENRGRYAIGAVHKLNGLDGAAYVLENRKPFGIGITGRSSIKITKDRPGQLRRHGLPSSGGLHWFGDLVVDSHDQDNAEVTVEAPNERSDDWRPVVLMERIVKVLENGPLAQRRICVAVQGKTPSIRDALDYLILDGYVSEKTPHELLKPYP
jgi:hypothetical protein